MINNARGPDCLDDSRAPMRDYEIKILKFRYCGKVPF